MHLRIQDAAGVTIDLARATVPGGLPIAVLPLPPSMGSIKAKNGLAVYPKEMMQDYPLHV